MSRWPERTTVFPSRAPGLAASLAEEPVLLDGMKVLFDEKVALQPVTLEPEGRTSEPERPRRKRGRNGP